MKYFSIFFLLCICSGTLDAQEIYFTDAVEIFSRKKTAYVTLADGTDIEGTIHRIKNKRGLVKELKLKFENGEIKTLLPTDINRMYLPQSGWDKMMEASKMEVTKWGQDDVNVEYLKEGYAYFETTEVMLNAKKKETLILQMVNPAFGNKIKVFFDPYAQETISAGVAGMKLAGGHDKSYYVKMGNEIAFKLKKKDYDDRAMEMYKDCKSYWLEVKDDIVWSNFPKQVYMHSGACLE